MPPRTRGPPVRATTASFPIALMVRIRFRLRQDHPRLEPVWRQRRYCALVAVAPRGGRRHRQDLSSTKCDSGRNFFAQWTEDGARKACRCSQMAACHRTRPQLTNRKIAFRGDTYDII